MGFFSITNNEYHKFYRSSDTLIKEYKGFNCKLIRGTSFLKLTIKNNNESNTYYLIPFQPYVTNIMNFNKGIDKIISSKNKDIEKPFNRFSVKLVPAPKYSKNIDEIIQSCIEFTYPYFESAILREWELNEKSNNYFIRNFTKGYLKKLPSVEKFISTRKLLKKEKFSDIWEVYGYNDENLKELGVSNLYNSEVVTEFVIRFWINAFSDNTIDFKALKELAVKKMSDYASELYSSGVRGLVIQPSIESVMEEIDNAIKFEQPKERIVKESINIKSNPTSFIDENGEPNVIYHSTTQEREGQPMSKDELHRFAVELLASRYQSEGMEIIDINRIIGKEYPQFVMKSRNEKIYYVVVEPAIFPTRPDTLYSNNYQDILELAKTYNAIPVFAGISFANATKEDMSKLICGDGYFVAFKGLEYLQ